MIPSPFLNYRLNPASPYWNNEAVPQVVKSGNPDLPLSPNHASVAPDLW